MAAKRKAQLAAATAAGRRPSMAMSLGTGCETRAMALPAGPHSYVVLWTRDYCRRLRRAGDLGRPLEVLYGGAHGSQPLISRYGVRAGDTIYAVSVADGALLVVGGMTVVAIVDWLEYV